MSNWVQNFKFTGSKSVPGGYFGSSVSVNSDGNIVVISAPGNGITNTGLAYIYTGSGNNWQEVAILSGNNIGESRFGLSTSINAQGNTIAIGADNSAYIFTGSGNNWNQAIKFTTGSGIFGRAATAINSDGTTLLIGIAQWAPGIEVGTPDSNMPWVGTAYIFTGSGNNWSKVVQFTGSGAYNFFGNVVAINSSGNIAVISEQGLYGAGNNKIRIFTGNGNIWNQTKEIKNNSGEFGAGISLNSRGDIAIIGAPNGPINKGLGHIYTGSGNNWSQPVVISGENIGDYFGISTSLNAKGNVALIGAPYYTTNQISLIGAAYIFSGDNNNWTKIAKITGNVGENALFGSSTAFNSKGDIALIGSPYNDNNTGSVYIFTSLASSSSSSSSSNSTNSSSSSFNINPSNFISSNYFQFNDPNNCHNLPTFITGIHVETGSFSLDLINLLSGFYNNTSINISSSSSSSSSINSSSSSSSSIILDNIFSVGQAHHVAILKDKSVTGWGFNLGGQINFPYINNASKVSAGYNSTIILSDNGYITGFGECPGINSQNPLQLPEQIQGQVKDIAVGACFSAALLKDGTVTTWGRENPNHYIDPALQAPGRIKKIFSSYSQKLVLLYDNGYIAGYGGIFGGDNTLNFSNDIQGKVVDVDPGQYYSIILLNDGTVTGYGSYAGVSFGQNTNFPNSIQGNVTGVAAATTVLMALLKDGSVTGWGYATAAPGQLNIPSSIQGNVTGIFGGSFHFAAILKNGTVTAWGENYGGLNLSSPPNVNLFN